jgi:hypothetical protein
MQDELRLTTGSLGALQADVADKRSGTSPPRIRRRHCAQLTIRLSCFFLLL